MLPSPSLSSANKQKLITQLLFATTLQRRSTVRRYVCIDDGSSACISSIEQEQAEHAHLQLQHQEVAPHQLSSSQPEPAVSKPPAVFKFKFKHFTLMHGGPCAMKMGTDAMLLGAWAQPPEHTAAVLDGESMRPCCVIGC
jgi:hypothetical protein